MPDWSTIAPRRADQVTDGLRRLANTARRDYDVDPERARAMLSEIEDPLAAVKAAYAPRLGEAPEDTAEAAALAAAPIQLPGARL